MIINFGMFVIWNLLIVVIIKLSVKGDYVEQFIFLYGQIFCDCLCGLLYFEIQYFYFVLYCGLVIILFMQRINLLFIVFEF